MSKKILSYSKKILITGATGFIGSYLAKFFTKEGYKDF
jgi:nucleoside-diphosphate-sugar epimerase